MAFFSNSTEYDQYRARYCERCIYDEDLDCPVIALHMVWNYESTGMDEESRRKRYALDLLIPRSPNGLENAQCNLFAISPAAARDHWVAIRA